MNLSDEDKDRIWSEILQRIVDPNATLGDVMKPHMFRTARPPAHNEEPRQSLKPRTFLLDESEAVKRHLAEYWQAINKAEAEALWLMQQADAGEAQAHANAVADAYLAWGTERSDAYYVYGYGDGWREGLLRGLEIAQE